MPIRTATLSVFKAGSTVACAIGGLLLAGHATAAAQDTGGIAVEQIEWGFDGKAVTRTFTPLSVLLANPGPNPAEGTIQLSRAIQLTQRVGAVCEVDYYISPGESRWVQFTPYVMGDWESWSLSWGESRLHRLDVPTPRLGEPAVILIDDPNGLDGGGGVLRRFNQERFPVSVTGADGLDAVVLDFAPDWQGARAQAFIDWLRSGGRAYVIHGPNGRYPEFSGELSILNQSEDRVRVGAGLVKRIPLESAKFDRETAQSLIFDDEQPTAPPVAPSNVTPFTFGGMIGWDRDRQLFIDLESLARFHRNWWLVYSAVFLYLLTLFPGCYLLGRNNPDVRVFYSGFLGSTLLFSLLFAWLGEIGSSEQNRVRSAATAHQLEDGLYDVTQWSSVAVVNGGTYELRHQGGGRLYSTCQEFEAVNGIITTGANGSLTVDMPPVSTRTVLNRLRLPGSSLGLRMDAFLADERGISALTLSTGDQFPRDAESAFAAHRGLIHPLAIRENDLTLLDRGIPTATFVNSFELMGWQRPRWGASPAVDQLDDEDVMFENMLRMLIGNSYELRGRSSAAALVLPSDLVRIFIYAPMPEEFFVANEEFQEQQGRVLYVVDLPVAYDTSLEVSE